MAITGIHVTDFIVWMPVSMKVQQINFDNFDMHPTLVNKLIFSL